MVCSGDLDSDVEEGEGEAAEGDGDDDLGSSSDSASAFTLFGWTYHDLSALIVACEALVINVCTGVWGRDTPSLLLHVTFDVQLHLCIRLCLLMRSTCVDAEDTLKAKVFVSHWGED